MNIPTPESTNDLDPRIIIATVGRGTNESGGLSRLAEMRVETALEHYQKLGAGLIICAAGTSIYESNVAPGSPEALAINEGIMAATYATSLLELLPEDTLKPEVIGGGEKGSTVDDVLFISEVVRQRIRVRLAAYDAERSAAAKPDRVPIPNVHPTIHLVAQKDQMPRALWLARKATPYRVVPLLAPGGDSAAEVRKEALMYAGHRVAFAGLEKLGAKAHMQKRMERIRRVASSRAVAPLLSKFI